MLRTVSLDKTTRRLHVHVSYCYYYYISAVESDKCWSGLSGKYIAHVIKLYRLGTERDDVDKICTKHFIRTATTGGIYNIMLRVRIVTIIIAAGITSSSSSSSSFRRTAACRPCPRPCSPSTGRVYYYIMCFRLDEIEKKKKKRDLYL